MNKPLALSVSVPCSGSLTLTAVSGLPSTSLSLLRTPATSTISVVLSGVL
jgi:hypothetical protein